MLICVPKQPTKKTTDDNTHLKQKLFGDTWHLKCDWFDYQVHGIREWNWLL